MTDPKPKQQPGIAFRDVALEVEVATRTDDGGSRSLTAKEHLTRYFRILAAEASRLAFTGQEWVALRAATISRHFDNDGPVHLGFSVHDAFEAGELDPGWDKAAVVALMDRLEALSPAQQWAVVDLLERWRVRDV